MYFICSFWQRYVHVQSLSCVQICNPIVLHAKYSTKLFLIFMIFIYLAQPQVLVVEWGIWFPNQGWNPGLLHWEWRVLSREIPYSTKLKSMKERQQKC